MYAEGYKYWLAHKTNTTSYYRCCRYTSSKCPGRCTSENGSVRSTIAHNHPPEPDRALVDKFRKILTQRAATEKTELYAIYCDEATTRHSDAAMLYPFSSAESAMRKARRKQLPQTPNTVTDVVDILDKSDLFRVNSGSDKDSIYQTTLRLDDSTCMIFMHRKTVDLFAKIDEIHLDGTMDFALETSPNYHLITIHAVQNYITAPIIYALLTAKTQSAYAALFTYIREDLSIVPSMIMSDFDHAMQSSLAYIFPEAIIKGSWLLYTDAVLSHMKSLNLQRETSKGVGASALRMLLVLPLLPAEYMSLGLESLKKWMKEKNIFSDSLANLCDYIEYGWLRSIGAEKMSIFGTPRSISNHLKNFNKELIGAIGSQNPAIWNILDTITQLATKMFVKVNKRMKAAKAERAKTMCGLESSGSGKQQPPGRLQRKNDLVTDTIISSATQLWIKTPVHLRNPLQFLQLSSHCINDTIYLANATDSIQIRSSTSNARHQAWNQSSKSQQQPQLQQTSSDCLPSSSYLQQSNQQNSVVYNCLPSNSSRSSNVIDNNSCNENVPRSTSMDIVCNQELVTSLSASIPHTTSESTSCFTTTKSIATQLDPEPGQPEQQVEPMTVVQFRPVSATDPPPLAFFPSVKQLAHKRRLPLLSEPPPLVPISSNYTKKVLKR